jgi:hypothetical protein
MTSQKQPPRTRKRSEPASWSPAPGLNRDIQAKIGEQLRQMHDEIVKQGVPDRFADLLAKLDRTEDGKGD